MKKVLAMLAMSLLLGAPSAQAALTGALGIAENTCVSPIALFMPNVSCSYSGAANFNADKNADPYYGGSGWGGPLDAGGFYTSVAAAPSFSNSTLAGDEYCVGTGCPGRPLTSFLVGDGATAGDGKVAPSVDGSGITITGSGTAAVIGGTFTIGAATRQTGTGSNLAGSKQVVESWTSITHTIVEHVFGTTIPQPKGLTVDSATDLGGGAWEYIIGSDGFPPLLCAQMGLDCFAAETGYDTDFDPSTSPWAVANGGSGPQSSIFDTAGIAIDIVSYGIKDGTGAGKNPGIKTTAVISGGSCLDTGLDPDEANDDGTVFVDDVSDCVDTSVGWTVGDNAGFDNMVLKITTDTDGEITDLIGYYTLEYQSLGSGVNSWVGSTISLSSAVIPVPAAVWLFGSALGLLGWIRRRAIA
jgi:hypothetical protein